MISRCSFLAGVLVASAVVCSANAGEKAMICPANAGEKEPMSPQLRQAALRHISDSSTSKSTGRMRVYLEGYKDGVKAQLLQRDNKLIDDYGGDDPWGWGYEQGIVDVRWSKGTISFADLSYEEYFKGVGGLRFGFEESSFSPENTNERWWVEALAGPSKSFDGCAKCLVQGWITKRGTHGHLGQYQRAIMVISVEPNGAQVETKKP